MQTVILNNGVEIPILGLGVYQMDDLAECERSVLYALESGYRLIDTAAIYGNEEAVGRTIKKSGIPRQELFITTKLWVQRQGYEGAKRAFETSMAKLQLDYLDLYLIHQPFGDVYGSWRAMEELYREGRIRAIGVSNFQPDRLMDLILHNEIVPALNQIELHPFCQQRETQAFQCEQKVQTQSWGPLAQSKNDVFKNPALLAIAAKHGKTVAQVILRWLIQRDIVVIPKSVHKTRILENIAVFDFALDAADMQAIARLDTGKPMFDHHDPRNVTRLAGFKVRD